MDSFKKYIAEFIGTFVLVLLGCGVAAAMAPHETWLLLAFGFAFAAAFYAIGSISGCHINPAVSLAMLICSKLSVKDFIGYVIAQFAGGIAGAALLIPIAGKDAGVNYIASGGLLFSIFAEIVLTFVFVLTVLGVTAKTENGAVSGLAIGISLILVNLAGLYLGGNIPSVNPARSFGPAIFAGGNVLTSVWVFILAPLVGGALAALIHLLLFKKKDGKTPDTVKF